MHAFRGAEPAYAARPGVSHDCMGPCLCPVVAWCQACRVKGCLVLREVAAGVWLGVFVGCRPAWRSRDVTWCLMAVQLCGWWSRVWRCHVLLAGNIGCNLCLYICVLMGLLLRLSGPRPLATASFGGLEVRHPALWGDPFGCRSTPCPRVQALPLPLPLRQLSLDCLAG